MSYRDFELRDLKLLAAEMDELAARHEAEADRKDFAADELKRAAFELRHRARVAARVREWVEAEMDARAKPQDPPSSG